MSKKVSIIIPVYNGEEYMREAIDSALAQTYENKEIIVINDGSRDNTDKIAKSYGDKITYYAKENGGVSTALNLGIEKMTGDYFSWLSHDDRYYPEKVEKEIKYLEEHGLLDSNTILYSDYDLMDEKSHVYAGSVKDHKLLTENPDYCILHGDINGLSLLIPKKAFADCGGFRTDLRCVQDYVLWEEMRKAGYNFIHIPEILVTTRIHSMQQGNTSPVMVSEGNDFWVNLIKDTSKERMIRFEGSTYGFYKKMHDIMATTPYDKAEEFTRKECERIINGVKDTVKNTKVTVVLPFCKWSKDIEKSIDSVFAQTHKNIEFLLICYSENNSNQEAKEYIKNAEFETKIIHSEAPSGLTGAKNTGIKNASGDYISFLNTGDIFIPSKTEEQLIETIASNSCISHTNYYIKREDSEEFTAVDVSFICGKGVHEILTGRLVSPSAIMVKTSFLKENGINFNPAFCNAEDICFFLSCQKNAYVHAVSKPLLIINEETAYDREEQLKGYKALINYVLSDTELSKNDYEIGCLFAEYIMNYNLGDNIKQINMYPAPEKKVSILRRTVRALKRGGVGYTIKAGAKKVINKIKK